MLAGVLLITTCATATVAISPKVQNEEIAEYILNHLSYDDQNVLSYVWGPVSAGQKILTTKGPLFIAPSQGYVLYIDLYPTANLFHPVQYVFLKESTNDLLVFD